MLGLIAEHSRDNKSPSRGCIDCSAEHFPAYNFRIIRSRRKSGRYDPEGSYQMNISFISPLYEHLSSLNHSLYSPFASQLPNSEASHPCQISTSKHDSRINFIPSCMYQPSISVLIIRTPAPEEHHGMPYNTWSNRAGDFPSPHRYDRHVDRAKDHIHRVKQFRL